MYVLSFLKDIEKKISKENKIIIRIILAGKPSTKLEEIFGIKVHPKTIRLAKYTRVQCTSNKKKILVNK